MTRNTDRLPYDAPDTSAVVIYTEQSIAIGSDESSSTLGGIDGQDIYDEGFDPISLP